MEEGIEEINEKNTIKNKLLKKVLISCCEGDWIVSSPALSVLSC